MNIRRIRTRNHTGGILHNSLQKMLLLACCVLLTLMLAACSFAQPAFVQRTNTIAGGFAAAAATLTYLHHGKLSYAYAVSSFDNYASELQGLDTQLSSQKGAPTRQKMQHLLTLYKAGMRVMEHPCLQPTCAWQPQYTLLNQASQAFQEVSAS